MHAILSAAVAPDLTSEWRELLARHARTVCALDEALDEFGLGMSEFEVLDRLACECAERPRMQDLARLLHLSQSALSRTVGRLEKEGLVERAMCPDDRRGISVCLTETGRSRWSEASPVHRRVLSEQLDA
jgi:DNA-binding MarR family transcriptional regulator